MKRLFVVVLFLLISVGVSGATDLSVDLSVTGDNKEVVKQLQSMIVSKLEETRISVSKGSPIILIIKVVESKIETEKEKKKRKMSQIWYPNVNFLYTSNKLNLKAYLTYKDKKISLDSVNEFVADSAKDFNFMVEGKADLIAQDVFYKLMDIELEDID